MLKCHVVQKNENFAKVLKNNKIKDIKAVWLLDENRALRKLRKNPEAVQCGDKLHIFDPLSKIVVVTIGSKKYYIPEKEWKGPVKKQLIALFEKKLLARLLKEHTVWLDDYLDFEKLRKEMWYVSIVSGLFSSAPDPMAAMTKANANLANVESIIKKGAFDRLPSALSAYLNELDKYLAALFAYKEGYIDGAQKMEHGLTKLRDGCFTFCAILGATAIAPATIIGAAAVGAISAGGTAVLKEGSIYLGNHMAGMPNRASQKLDGAGRRVMEAAAVGFINGLVGGALGKLFGKLFSGSLAKSKLLGDTIDRGYGALARHVTGADGYFIQAASKLGTRMAKQTSRQIMRGFIIRCIMTGSGFGPALRDAFIKHDSLLRKEVLRILKAQGTKGSEKAMVGELSNALLQKDFVQTVVENLVKNNKEALNKAFAKEAERVQASK